MKYFLCILFIILGTRQLFAAELILDVSGVVTKEEILINNKSSISKFKIIRHESKKKNALTEKIFKYFKKN